MAQKPFIDITLGPLNHDLAGTPAKPGYLVDSQGLRPSPTGLRPIPTLADVGGAVAVPGNSVGRLYTAEFNTTTSIFACTLTTAGSNTRLHQSNDSGANWSDVEGASGAPGLFADFCQFDEFVIATSRAVAPQSKSLFAAVATDFANLAGSPPTGLTCARVRDHVVIGNLTTDDLSRHAVRWSAFGNPEDWPTPGTADARSKQAGIQYLPVDLGQIVKIVGGEKFGLIFQLRGITRMTYVGGASVYEFDTFEKKVGAGTLTIDGTNQPVPHPVVQVGNFFYWFNQPDSALYATDGYTVRKISLGKLDTLNPSVSTSHVSAAFDAIKNMLLFIGTFSVDKHLAYFPELDEFSYLPAGDFGSVGDYVQSNGRTILNLPADLIIQTLTSATQQTATLQTGYVEVDPGFHVQLQGVHLLGKGTPGNLTVSAKAVSSYADIDTATSGFTSLSEQTIGKKLQGRLSGRFFSFRVIGVPTSTQLIQGFRVFFTRGEPA